jgi:hypothetical protein
MNTRNILSLKNISQVDNIKKLTQGGLNNIVKRFDLLKGELTQTPYVNSQKQSQFKFASKKPLGLNTTHFESTYGANAAVSLLVPHSSALPENYIDTTIGARHSYVTKMGQNLYQAFVYGDTALTAGDVITVNVPSSVNNKSNNGDNRLIAGNYLMSKVRHNIINRDDTRNYHVSLELIKGFQEDYS